MRTCSLLCVWLHMLSPIGLFVQHRHTQPAGVVWMLGLPLANSKNLGRGREVVHNESLTGLSGGTATCRPARNGVGRCRFSAAPVAVGVCRSLPHPAGLACPVAVGWPALS